MKHVPYRSASLAAQGTAAGQTDLSVQGLATVAALTKAGKMKLLGVVTDQRNPEYPDAPTLKEQGVQGFEYSTWFGLTAPKGTPKAIVDKLQQEVAKALTDPVIKARYAGLGLRSNGGTPEQMSQLVRSQLDRYGKAIRDNNIKAE